jgi:hypothetical protein
MLVEEEYDHLASALVADGMRPHGFIYQQQPNQQIQKSLVPPSLQDEESAALVSDGIRPTSTLPPYTPGRSRMPGHADERNDMRLSEYVKGETRAQDLKDSGRVG